MNALLNSEDEDLIKKIIQTETLPYFKEVCAERHRLLSSFYDN